MFYVNEKTGETLSENATVVPPNLWVQYRNRNKIEYGLFQMSRGQVVITVGPLPPIGMPVQPVIWKGGFTTAAARGNPVTFKGK